MKKIFTLLITLSLLCTQGLYVFGSEAIQENSNHMKEETTISGNQGNDSSFVNGDSGEKSLKTIDLDNLDTEIQAVLNDNTLSEQEKNAKVEKLNIYRIDKAISRSTSKSSAKLNVWVATQQNDYYCGPATVQQTLTYTNGSSASQDTIASAIGTTKAGSALSNMVSYVNDHINDGSHVGYDIISDPNVAQIQSTIEYACNIGHPIMCRLKFSKGGDWAYSTNGHFMNANGYKDYGEYIYVTDPNIKRVNSSASGSYYVHVNSIYHGTHDHFAQEMAS